MHRMFVFAIANDLVNCGPTGTDVNDVDISRFRHEGGRRWFGVMFRFCDFTLLMSAMLRRDTVM